MNACERHREESMDCILYCGAEFSVASARADKMARALCRFRGWPSGCKSWPASAASPWRFAGIEPVFDEGVKRPVTAAASYSNCSFCTTQRRPRA